MIYYTYYIKFYSVIFHTKCKFIQKSWIYAASFFEWKNYTGYVTEIRTIRQQDEANEKAFSFRWHFVLSFGFSGPSCLVLVINSGVGISNEEDSGGERNRRRWWSRKWSDHGQDTRSTNVGRAPANTQPSRKGNPLSKIRSLSLSLSLSVFLSRAR